MDRNVYIAWSILANVESEMKKNIWIVWAEELSSIKMQLII